MAQEGQVHNLSSPSPYPAVPQQSRLLQVGAALGRIPMSAALVAPHPPSSSMARCLQSPRVVAVAAQTATAPVSPVLLVAQGGSQSGLPHAHTAVVVGRNTAQAVAMGTTPTATLALVLRSPRAVLPVEMATQRAFLHPLDMLPEAAEDFTATRMAEAVGVAGATGAAAAAVWVTIMPAHQAVVVRRGAASRLCLQHTPSVVRLAGALPAARLTMLDAMAL